MEGKPTPVDTDGHTLTHPPTQLPVVACSTYNRAKQTQTGGVALPSVSRALLPGRRQRYTQADGPVKLAPPRLHSDHGAKVRLVTQQLCNQLIWNWLSLMSKHKWWREREGGYATRARVWWYDRKKLQKKKRGTCRITWQQIDWEDGK